MKRLIFVFISVCFFANSYCQVLQQKLDDYMQALSKHSGFNGVVLVAKNGTILLEKGYGFRDAATKVNHTENSVFQIGSVTKQLTAAIILALEKEGKLSVKDKLSKYFPEYAHASKITVEDLLHHVSGIYNYTNDKDFMQNRVTQPLTEAAFWNLIKDKPLDFEPGTQYNYSNSGYSILGYIIRKVSKQPYETIVRQRIFQVAGMTHSGFDFTNFRSPEKSTGYSLFNKETAIPAPIVDSTVAYSAGAIFSTVRDLYKWNTALNSGKIISAADLERAYKPYKQNYGYGVGIDSIFGKRRISHGGGIHGFVSYLTYVPADQVTIALLSNKPFPLGSAEKDLLAILYEKPYKLAEEIVEIKVDSSILKKYVGDYELTPTFKITISLTDGSLKAQATGQPSFDLFAREENRFFLKVVDAQLEFLKNDKGEVDRLILHQNGQQLPGKKVK